MTRAVVADSKTKQRAKKQARNAERCERKRRKGWTKLTAQAICGCCEAVLWFKSRAAAEAARDRVGWKHATVTDDEGTSEKIDGFYGFELEDY